MEELLQVHLTQIKDTVIMDSLHDYNIYHMVIICAPDALYPSVSLFFSGSS